MISIGAAANLCCNCANKANTIIFNSNTPNNKVVVWWNWKTNLPKKTNDRFLLVTCSSARTRKTRWRPNGDHPPLTVTATGTGAVLLIMMIFSAAPVTAATIEQTKDSLSNILQEQSTDTLSNIPQTLSGEDCKKARIQHPKSRNAERCTSKCVTTCIQGGAGSPGEGPFNARRPLVVFKEGFRSRQYCLVECSDICNLLKDGDDGP